jgi:hypothetical protein
VVQRKVATRVGRTVERGLEGEKGKTGTEIARSIQGHRPMRGFKRCRGRIILVEFGDKRGLLSNREQLTASAERHANLLCYLATSIIVESRTVAVFVLSGKCPVKNCPYEGNDEPFFVLRAGEYDCTGDREGKRRMVTR